MLVNGSKATLVWPWAFIGTVQAHLFLMLFRDTVDLVEPTQRHWHRLSRSICLLSVFLLALLAPE